MIKYENNTLEVKGSSLQLGAELSVILCSMKNDNVPLPIFSSAIHTFMHDSLTTEEQDELLEQLKLLAKFQGR